MTDFCKVVDEGRKFLDLNLSEIILISKSVTIQV